ncbi:MAG TPA: hypothetical protein VL460_03975 [Caulobacteraceae bacterium]|nr:hypothetical protein [Caulobacteraceae bacterium]
MNPEFQRNLWLEAGPRRLAWTAVVLAAIYGSVLLIAPGQLSPLGGAGLAVFAGAALIWGPRTSGGAVAEEVRQRTWDFQRLSALTPWEMTWGKLFGATALSWGAGATGLALAFVVFVLQGKPQVGLQMVVCGLGAALLLQAGSMALALVTVRRARAEGRIPAFRFTFGGLVGLLIVASTVGKVMPTRGLGGAPAWLGLTFGNVHWWGLALPRGWFLAVSLVAFGAWALAAAWRLMRLELQMQNGPWVWPAFVLFAGVWAAGLADGGLTLRFAVAGAVFAACAYGAAFAEPADRVRMRQFADALRRRDMAAMTATVPAVVAPVKLAVLAVIGIAVAPLLGEGIDPSPLLALAALAFLLRDLGVVAYFRFGPRPGRGDFGAVLGLFLAYFLGGIVGASLGGASGAALFTPNPAGALVSAVSGGLQAAVVWFFAWRRIHGPEVSQA